MLIHASCVQWQNKGILFVGDSGCGKSTASLALIEKGAVLVADDYVKIELKNDKIEALCPKNIFEKIEVRGIGIVPMKAIEKTSVDVVIRCIGDFSVIERMPEKEQYFFEKKALPMYRLCPFENIFSTKVSLILATL